MTMISILAATALLVAPDASFESDGIRVDGALIQGPALQVRQAEGQMMLVSGAVVEAINAELRISLRADRVLVLEPGIRVTRRENGIFLSAHGNRPFTIGNHSVTGPTRIAPTTEGWSWAEISVKGNELRVALPRKGALVQDDPAPQDPAATEQPVADEQPAEQDNPDKALKRMMGSSERARRDLRLPALPKKTLRYRRVFTGDPTIVGNGVDSDVLKPLPKISPVGP